MINPVTVMKVLGERKTFINNHPEFLWFLLENFGETTPEGSVIELKVQKPGKEEKEISICLQKSDENIMDALSVLIEQIKS